eukprot:2787229-Amphidinium_carterae.1
MPKRKKREEDDEYEEDPPSSSEAWRQNVTAYGNCVASSSHPLASGDGGYGEVLRLRLSRWTRDRTAHPPTITSGHDEGGAVGMAPHIHTPPRGTDFDHSHPAASHGLTFFGVREVYEHIRVPLASSMSFQPAKRPRTVLPSPAKSAKLRLSQRQAWRSVGTSISVSASRQQTNAGGVTCVPTSSQMASA